MTAEPEHDHEPTCPETHPAPFGQGFYRCTEAPRHAGDHVVMSNRHAGTYEVECARWPADIEQEAVRYAQPEAGAA